MSKYRRRLIPTRRAGGGLRSKAAKKWLCDVSSVSVFRRDQTTVLKEFFGDSDGRQHERTCDQT